jgi:hypothetical protein
LKRILEKSVGANHKDWSDKLDHVLWSNRISYKTQIGSNPYRLIYGKACQLSVEIEHKDYWALRTANIEMLPARKNRFHQIQELDELQMNAYENSLFYKETTKKWHDDRIKTIRNFTKGDMVLLYNSRLKLFPGKLRSGWSGPYIVLDVSPYGTVEIANEKGERF